MVKAREGVLVLVATPIGNLGDLSTRAVSELKHVDVIMCEDTRHTGKLLAHAGIQRAQLVPLHDHNESAQMSRVLQELKRGSRVAMVSDAGMPAISDPGQRTVAAAIEAGYKVEVVPGPSALTGALVVSGLPTQPFTFEGFLPRKGKERNDRLAAMSIRPHTNVLYEAPHRLAKTLVDLKEWCGSGRRIVLVRELTKLHEEVWRGTIAEAIEFSEEREPRGEYVLIVAGAARRSAPTPEDIEEALQERMGAGEDKKEAIASVAADLDVSKKRVYEVALRF